MRESGRDFLATVLRAYARLPNLGDEGGEFFVDFDAVDRDECMLCDGGEVRPSVDDAFRKGVRSKFDAKCFEVK